jgi:hypothetical protein
MLPRSLSVGTTTVSSRGNGDAGMMTVDRAAAERHQGSHVITLGVGTRFRDKAALPG